MFPDEEVSRHTGNRYKWVASGSDNPLIHRRAIIEEEHKDYQGVTSEPDFVDRKVEEYKNMSEYKRIGNHRFQKQITTHQIKWDVYSSIEHL